jgi:hypothetical protein
MSSSASISLLLVSDLICDKKSICKAVVLKGLKLNAEKPNFMIVF